MASALDGHALRQAPPPRPIYSYSQPIKTATTKVCKLIEMMRQIDVEALSQLWFFIWFYSLVVSERGKKTIFTLSHCVHIFYCLSQLNVVDCLPSFPTESFNWELIIHQTEDCLLLMSGFIFVYYFSIILIFWPCDETNSVTQCFLYAQFNTDVDVPQCNEINPV